MERQVVWLLLAVFFAFSACTAKKDISPTVAEQRPAPEESTPPDSQPASEEPEIDAAARARSEAIEATIAQARELYEEGREQWSAGDRDLARGSFRRSLELVSSSGIPIHEDLRLEEAYEELLNEIQRLEIVASLQPDEPPFPILESLEPTDSPLDVIGAVNLFAVEVDPGLEDLVSEDLRSTVFDIPVVVKKEVLKFLDYYQGPARKSMEQSLVRSGRYLPLFQEIFKEEGLPLDLIYMAHVESLFKPQAYSRAHARGIWQFVRGTARLYDLKVGWWLDERLDYQKATRSAARYLKDLYDKFGSWYLALAAYNGGPGRVSRVLRRHGEMDYWTMARRRLLVRETRNFVPSILAAIIISRHPERYGFFVEPDEPLEFETTPLSYQVDLEVVAESIGVPLQQLMELNPELQRGVTPFETEGYLLKVPVGYGDKVTVELAKVPPEKRLRLKHHRVRQGETLSHISARYGTSIRAIAEVNRIRNIHRLKLGQDLIIPMSEWKASARAGSKKKALESGRHTVRRGDSLYRIARLYGVRLNDLFEWNDLEPGEHIHPGQQIRIVATSAGEDKTSSGAANN